MPDEAAPPGPDGAIDAAMTKVFGRSWRTQVAGLASLLAGAVTAIGVAQPGLLPPNVVAIAAALAPLIGGVGLLHAKDAKVSGPPNT